MHTELHRSLVQQPRHGRVFCSDCCYPFTLCQSPTFNKAESYCAKSHVHNERTIHSRLYTHDSILTTPYSRSILTTPHCRLHTHECTLSQVGVDPRLRDLARQLLLAVTNAEAVEEAVLVLMTDAAADTATQVVLAAEQLTPMLQQGPAAQALLLLFFACCSSTSSSHAGWFMQSFLVTVEGSGRM